MTPIVNPPPARDDEASPAGSTFERQVLREQLSRVEEEKRRALADPGLSWREWFFFDAAKWFVGLLFLILDAWLIVTWIDVALWDAILPSLVLALYAEFLLYEYLWYIPGPDTARRRGTFRPTWVRPVAYGRWTEDGVRARENPSADRDAGPSLEEFL